MSDSSLPAWTVACQSPLSMEFSKQECWSVLPFPSSGDLPDPGIEPSPPVLQTDSSPYSPCTRKIRSNAQQSVRKSTTSPWRWGVNWVFFVKAAWWYFQLSLKMSIPFGPANVFIFIYSRKTNKCKWKWCMNAYYGTINNSENINLKQSDSPSVKQWLWDIM